MMDGSLMVRSKCRPDIDHHPIFEVAPDEKSYYQSRDHHSPDHMFRYWFYEREIQNSKTLIINLNPKISSILDGWKYNIGMIY